MRRALMIATVSATVLVGTADLASAAHSPTCSEVLDIAVHGQHVVADYVTDIGHGSSGWPMAGGTVGTAVKANGGAALPGGPGPAFHFARGIAPGASFCTASNSPGVHL